MGSGREVLLLKDFLTCVGGLGLAVVDPLVPAGFAASTLSSSEELTFEDRLLLKLAAAG